MNGQKLNCVECKKDFLVIAQEEAFYKKKELPLPTRCPDCRQTIRLSFKNPRKLYQTNCRHCKQEILTTYTPDSPYIIYCQKCYREQMR